jgi:hypothetical protein
MIQTTPPEMFFPLIELLRLLQTLFPLRIQTTLSKPAYLISNLLKCTAVSDIFNRGE